MTLRSELHERVNITVTPSALTVIDEMADEMEMTRSEYLIFCGLSHAWVEAAEFNLRKLAEQALREYE